MNSAEARSSTHYDAVFMKLSCLCSVAFSRMLQQLVSM
ncbi:unnamed protein product [Arabidopsis thaliana]|uniref:(thale cress) hypothetical protein n=1 Tax=Arabidopsis thaliana TaxID=3702 RepID=A0A7G2EQK7_ARATH|nr:unnamed protein product [Arabidopsis thaliana]